MAVYERDGWGPEESDALLARDGHAWQMGCGEDGCLL
jgi:glucose-6-phosphate 1-dehydrogenase